MRNLLTGAAMGKVKNHYHEEIEKADAEREGRYKCEECGGTGAVDAPFSGSDPTCETCSGEGWVYV